MMRKPFFFSYCTPTDVTYYRHGKNLKDLRSKTTAKRLDWFNIWLFYHDFHGLKLSYFFYFKDC